MKIEISRGCTAFWNEIDGKDMSEYSEEELMNILLKICAKDKQNLIDSICHITEVLGNFECDEESCEQCGDSVHRFTLEI